MTDAERDGFGFKNFDHLIKTLSGIDSPVDATRFLRKLNALSGRP